MEILCSGCGKKIPYLGDVCPHCLRDKKPDRENFDKIARAVIWTGLAGGLIGYLSDGTALGFALFFAGCAVGGIIGAFQYKPVTSKAPEVQPVKDDTIHKAKPSTAEQSSHSIEDRLATLKKLKEQGLISDADYDQKRQELLRDL